MRYKVIYFVFFLLAIVSCTGNKKYDNLMQRADSIMDVDDDSAKIAIRMLDGIKTAAARFDEKAKNAL